MNEQLEIMGDAYDDFQDDAEREEANRERPEDEITEEDICEMARRHNEIPASWENAPLSAQIAFMIAGDDPELFDSIKADLKGE